MAKNAKVSPLDAKRAAKSVTKRNIERTEKTAQTFDEAFEDLNDAQRDAVDSIEGPVLVVAGPGTGKTQVIAVRVANILRKTQMRPSNILCLTFSVSGATAMRERLRGLIGSDAYAVTVSTIHGFCRELISGYPQVFEEWNALDHISDIERYRELNKIIDQFLPELNLVNPRAPYLRTRDILERISQVKREGKSEADLRAAADWYEADMAEKSKEGTKAHERNLLSVRKFREFVEIFARYQEMLALTRRYDYEDMILRVITALREHDWLLASLQERFQYILVDEFQDTNGAQYRLIETLTTYAVEQEPNLFVVGDDDQSIYRFQGANLQNILSFRERFPSAEIIVLTVNYRSTQAILDAAGRLIAHNTERLVREIPGLTKDLTAASAERGNEPQLLRAPSDTAEPWLLADLIEERIARGVPLSEIAVLVQTNAELTKYYDVLAARNIPVQMTGKLDLLSHPLVRQAIAILRAIDRPQTSELLAAALAAECFGCHPADLGRLFLLRKERQSSLYDMLLSLEDIPQNAGKNSVAFHDVQCLLRVRDLIVDQHQKLPTRTILEVIERIMKDCGLLREPLDPINIAALEEFYERVKAHAQEKPGYGTNELLDDLAFYANPDYSALRLSYDLPHLVADGVQLMTAHQSKGQEFEVVFLTNFRDGHWDKRRHPPGVSLPEDILFGWEREQRAFEQHQDERRVAYVAMTRAKHELLFLCPEELTSGEKAREVAPSAFFAEAGPLPEERRGLAAPEKASTLLAAPMRNLDQEFRAFIQHRLEEFALSGSALNRYLEDPRRFVEVDLLQIPQPVEWGLTYGNAVHWALRKWGTSILNFKPLSKEQFVEEFRMFLRDKEVLSDVMRGRLMHLGEEALPRYYEQKLAGRRPVIHRVEHAITTRLGDIPIKGLIDRIDLASKESGRATIIDYKTGRPHTENEIRASDLYRQLVFYSVLMEEGYSILQPEAYVIEFIGERAEHPVTRSFEIKSEEKEQMREMIRALWSKIIALDFTPL